MFQKPSTFPSSTCIHLHYIYAFSRHFYPKRLTLHSSYTFTFVQLLLSLGIEPMILALLAPCSTIWATGKLKLPCIDLLQGNFIYAIYAGSFHICFSSSISYMLTVACLWLYFQSRKLNSCWSPLTSTVFPYCKSQWRSANVWLPTT